MDKYLPVGWLALVPIAFIARLIATVPMAAKTNNSVFVGVAIDFFPSALLLGSFALVYSIFRRTTNRRLVFLIGWVHLFFATVSVGFGNYIMFYRNETFANGESPEFQQIALWSGISAITNTLALIALFAAVFAAHQDTRKRIELQTFD